MEDSSQGWTQLGSFFPKSGHFFSIFKKGQRRKVFFFRTPLKGLFFITDILDNKINGNRY